MRLVKLVAPEDAARLQRLLERCSDYYELHEGCATPPDAGEYELTAIPPVSAPDDLHVLALEDDHGVLHAVAQLVRNYPEQGVWWLSLLVVAPELRGRGIGPQLLQHALDAAAAAGATAMRLAVSSANPRAHSFWQRAGFDPTGQTMSVTARSGHVDTVHIMSREVAAQGTQSTAGSP
jgi:GNAT superfamily N-acetyltransferase